MKTSASLRRLPRHALVSALKARGVRQYMIATRAGTSQSTVSLVLSRKVRGPVAERVWRAIERALGGRAA